MKTATNELKKEYDVVRDADFVFEVEEARFKCLSCGYSWGFSEVKRKINEIFCGSPDKECDNPIHYVPDLVNSFIRSPKCGSPDFEVVAGRGVYIAKLERDIVEGLTEFFMGYVLYTRYWECYIAWIKSRYPVCAISYEKDVKLFGAIAQVLIPISDLAKIYVYNPSIDWYEQYRGFLDNYNMEDFLINKPKKKRKWPSRTLFENIIVKILREKACENLVGEFRDLLYEASISEVLN